MQVKDVLLCNTVNFLQRIYGGKYSNHQVPQIIAESPLIEVYKNTRIQFEKMFCLEHKTARHSPPDMKATFSKLATYMAVHNTNLYQSGRGHGEELPYAVPDVAAKGMGYTSLEKNTKGKHTNANSEELDEEVEDDGLLNV